MRIFTYIPDDWKKLEKQTYSFLKDMGYECEMQKKIQTVRGEVNIDVFAENRKEIPNSILLCECKYWNKSVPQTVIHSFRTVVSDYGANFGIIISKNGFQTGAIEATKNSNILLFDWLEFEKLFKIKWIKTKTLTVSKISKPLFDYVSVGFRVFFKDEYNNLTAEKIDLFEQLTMRHFDVAFYSSNLNYDDLESGEFDLKWYESMVSQAQKKFGMNFLSLEEYYSYLLKEAELATKEFDDFFGKEIRAKKL